MNVLISLILMLLFSVNIASGTPIIANSSININTELQQLSQKAPQLDTKVLKLALTAYEKAKHNGVLKKPILTVIDYSKPSSTKRMWIFDVNKQRLLFTTQVAHGKNSGQITPSHFSNRINSKETSLGTFVTEDTYIGGKGLSLNLKGLEKGFNDNAYTRRVVVHGAWYVNADFIKSTGHAGRSWGCPAVPTTLAKPIINTIKDGSIVFAYYPSTRYMSQSHYL
jgi:hypothetical protein